MCTRRELGCNAKVTQLRQVTVTSPGASSLPSATTSSSTSSTTSTSTSPSTSTSALPPASPAPSPGLSTAGKIGLGVTLGAAALIALVALGLFLRRKRKLTQRSAPAPQELAYEPYQGQSGAAPALPAQREEEYKHEMYHDGGAAKYEMPGQMVAEVDGRGQERPAELMGDAEKR